MAGPDNDGPMADSVPGKIHGHFPYAVDDRAVGTQSGSGDPDPEHEINVNGCGYGQMPEPITPNLRRSNQAQPIVGAPERRNGSAMNSAAVACAL